MKISGLLFIVTGIASIVTATFTAGPAAAQAPSVDEIVEKANLTAYYQGADGIAKVKMTITDDQGREQIREFTILRMDVEDGGDQKFYTYFSRPADVRKMSYMVWKHVGKDDDRWLYLPGLDLVRRVAASDKRTSFVGSHFLYEDVSGRGLDEDSHVLERTEEKHYVVRNSPKEADSVKFSYYLVWIDRANMLPVKAEYYDKDGKHYRTVEALKVEEIQGHPTVLRSRVTDVVKGGSTLSEFSGVKYDIGLTDDIFTERYLKRPPRKWLK